VLARLCVVFLDCVVYGCVDACIYIVPYWRMETMMELENADRLGFD